MSDVRIGIKFKKRNQQTYDSAELLLFQIFSKRKGNQMRDQMKIQLKNEMDKKMTGQMKRQIVKNKIRKSTALFLSLMISMLLLPSLVFAIPSSSTMNITICVEGISQTLYFQTLDIPYSGTLNVKGALEYADNNSEDLSITGLATDFITSVNGENGSTFGGYDGWLYLVNGLDTNQGISGYTLATGDIVTLYYGDPFGQGMQIPRIDESRLSSGILKFTSNDTTYDDDWNPTVTTNPVSGATVSWFNNLTHTNFITNASGEITIPLELLTLGIHRIQIGKYGTTAVSGKYLPLVLRFDPVKALNVTSVITPSPTPSPTAIPTIQQTSSGAAVNNAPTSDSIPLIPVFLLAVSALVLLLVRNKRTGLEVM